MNGKSLGFTPRDEAIVREINRFGVMTREQLMRLRFFSSKTRAKDRLKRLVDAGYLDARRQALPTGGPRFVYLPGHLTGEPREARKRLTEVSDLFLAHELGLVDIRIAFEHHTTLTRWNSARDLTGLTPGLNPDAYLEYEVESLTYCAFVEYDRGTETLGRIERKVRAYVDLAHSGRFERTFRRRFFRVLVVADTDGRLGNLSRTAARLTQTVLRFTTMAQLSDQGPLQSIWRRPGASASESLMPS
jgi:protein involved in plasmid replication-relaxation